MSSTSIAARCRAARNLLDYALYVAFFPQLVAGPIERAGASDAAVPEARAFGARRRSSRALQLIVWGLFKKVVIADNLAPYVDAVYADPAEFSGTALVTATVFFAFQIYCDFSGYTDTARGVARMLGFDLMRNFDFPYFSQDAGRVLAALAHQPVAVVSGLSVLPARDALHAPGRLGEQVQGTHRLDGSDRPLAWRQLDVPAFRPLLGRGDRGVPGDSGTYLAAQQGGLIDRLAVAAVARADFGSIALMFTLVCVGWVLFRADSIGDAWYVLTHAFSSAELPAS